MTSGYHHKCAIKRCGFTLSMEDPNPIALNVNEKNEKK